MLVRYQLACCRARRRDTHTIDGIVQTCFQKLNKVFTRCTFQAGSLYIGVTELLFKKTVSVFCFLFFFQLYSIFTSRLTLARRAVLTRRVAVFLKIFA